MRSIRTLSLSLALALATAAVASAQVVQKKSLTLEAAKQVAAAAKAEAEKRGARVVIAVVDDGGHLLLLERLDGTQVASVEVGIGKARTAAIFRRPSKVFEEQVRNGRIAALGLPGATPLQGGLPLEWEGEVVGAIGVSGESPQEDEDVARAGVAALARTAPRTSLAPMPGESGDLRRPRHKRTVRNVSAAIPDDGVRPRAALARPLHKRIVRNGAASFESVKPTPMASRRPLHKRIVRTLS